MPLIKCPGCKRSFQNDIGLATHKRYCKGLPAASKTLLERHCDNLEAKRQRIDPPELEGPLIGLDGEVTIEPEVTHDDVPAQVSAIS